MPKTKSFWKAKIAREGGCTIKRLRVPFREGYWKSAVSTPAQRLLQVCP
jgi:hypothetical protein